MRILDYLIIFALFCGESIMAILGWRDAEHSNRITQLIPLFYLLLISNICSQSILQKKYRWHLIFMSIAIIVHKVFFNAWIYPILLGNIATPILTIYWAQDVIKRKNHIACLNILIGLFCVECLLAIIERFTHTLFFPYSLYNPDDINGYLDSLYFRSNALLGHPLTNAIVVSTIASFIAISCTYKRIKWPLFLLAYIAILCFNARIACFLFPAFFILYTILQYKANIKQIIPICILVCVSYYIIDNYNLADRLLNMEIGKDDSSTMARFDIFSIFVYFDSSIIYKGIYDFSKFVEMRLGLLHIENSFIHFTLVMGIIMAIYAYLMIIKLLWDTTSNYPIIPRLYVILNFFVIANANNTLSCQKTCLPIFITCSLFLGIQLSLNQQYKSTKSIYK